MAVSVENKLMCPVIIAHAFSFITNDVNSSIVDGVSFWEAI